MVVQKVKGLLYRRLKVPAADLKLTYTSPKVRRARFNRAEPSRAVMVRLNYSLTAGDGFTEPRCCGPVWYPSRPVKFSLPQLSPQQINSCV